MNTNTRLIFELLKNHVHFDVPVLRTLTLVNKEVSLMFKEELFKRRIDEDSYGSDSCTFYLVWDEKLRRQVQIKHGMFIRRDIKKRLKSIAKYQDGKKEGIQITYYDAYDYPSAYESCPSFPVSKIMKYESGRGEGDYVEYHPNGVIMRSGKCKDDWLVGEEILYHADGSVFVEKYHNPNRSVSIRRALDNSGKELLPRAHKYSGYENWWNNKFVYDKVKKEWIPTGGPIVGRPKTNKN